MIKVSSDMLYANEFIDGILKSCGEKIRASYSEEYMLDKSGNQSYAPCGMIWTKHRM